MEVVLKTNPATCFIFRKTKRFSFRKTSDTRPASTVLSRTFYFRIEIYRRNFPFVYRERVSEQRVPVIIGASNDYQYTSRPIASRTLIHTGGRRQQLGKKRSFFFRGRKCDVSLSRSGGEINPSGKRNVLQPRRVRLSAVFTRRTAPGHVVVSTSAKTSFAKRLVTWSERYFECSPLRSTSLEYNFGSRTRNMHFLTAVRLRRVIFV